MLIDPVDDPLRDSRGWPSVRAAARVMFVLVSSTVPALTSTIEYPSESPLLITNAQSVRVMVIPVVLLTNDVRVPNAPGIENEIPLKVVATDVVISPVFTTVAGFTTDIDVPTVATLIVKAREANVCSALNVKEDSSLIVASDDGNLVVRACSIVAHE